VCKNDQIRECHRPRIGVPKDSSLDINDQLTDFFREAGLTGARAALSARSRRLHAWFAPLFPRSVRGGQAFDPSRLPRLDEVSAMIVRGLVHVGFDPSLFSGISARRGGLPPPPSRRACRSTSCGRRAVTLKTPRRVATFGSAAPRSPTTPGRPSACTLLLQHSPVPRMAGLFGPARAQAQPARPPAGRRAARRPGRPAGGDVTGGT
jgi:hypothetical protein